MKIEIDRGGWRVLSKILTRFHQNFPKLLILKFVLLASGVIAAPGEIMRIFVPNTMNSGGEASQRERERRLNNRED